MTGKKRAIIIVLDSVGIGALPDAGDFGDIGSHTLGNILRVRGKLDLPNLYSLGLANITDSRLPKPENPVMGAYGRAMELTHAKDTTSGHWEIAGLPMKIPFRTYPCGFPPEVIQAFERRIGRGTLGNVVASGTQIIEQLGPEHIATGKPIIYTSADSVFQIAAHEEVICLDKLYEMCEIARELLHGENLVGRVIARPFVGTPGNFTRTENRRDYALEPPQDTLLDLLQKHGKITAGIGKIEDIFCHRGLSLVDHTKNNHTGIEATLEYLEKDTWDFLFVNLVDFDMLYGHRNNPEGYGEALEYFDQHLPAILSALKPQDLLIITADHGCDPTTPSTDHSREYIPIIVAGSNVHSGADIGTRASFSDIGATVYDYLTGQQLPAGTSFLSECWRI